MSSATQTDSTAAHAADPSAPRSPEGDPVSAALLARGLGIVALLGGWGAILYVYRWEFSAAVFFLLMGWLSVLLTGRYLWRAGMAAAEDTGEPEDDFWKPMGPREELLREKRALLKAIKEIEFDHQMGKTSEEDAAQLTRFYRLRAIEIIKTLETGGAGGQVPVQEEIAREVKARLAVARAGGKAASSGRKAAPAEAGAAAGSGEAAEAGAATGSGEAAGAKGAAARGGQGKKKRGKQRPGKAREKARAQEPGGEVSGAGAAGAEAPAGESDDSRAGRAAGTEVSS